jgi:hypothetical protein
MGDGGQLDPLRVLLPFGHCDSELRNDERGRW